MSMGRRTIFYVDGYNLYFGLRESKFQKYYWLDVSMLASNICRDFEVLKEVKYFTTRVSRPEDEVYRQSEYIDAINNLGNTIIYFGQFKKSKKKCSVCDSWYRHFTEKKTDVNIATEMLADAFLDRFDTAYLISGDSDLVPPIKKIREVFPEKIIKAVFPPKRFNSEIRNNVNGEIHIKPQHLKKSQLPDIVLMDSGQILRRPKEWI